MVPSQYTTTYLAKFVSQSFENLLSFKIARNPTAMYQYIKQNYPNEFPGMTVDMYSTALGLEQMCDFLLQKYNRLPANQRTHFIATLMDSLPKNAELQNWTTSIN
jgi:hypothetical protein